MALCSIFFSIFSIFLLTSVSADLFGYENRDAIENRVAYQRIKDFCDKRRPSNLCPREQQTVYITCGEKDARYMRNLEDDAMQYEDLVDPTRCLKYRFQDIEEVDFVVIGGGVAGSVVASRLSEQRAWTVALLEAGGPAPTASSIPGFYFNYRYDPSFDWKYELMRQPNACLRNGGVCVYPRGKVMGGTAVLHGMMYMRGNPYDYDHLEELGIKNWTWKDVLPVFLRSENNANVGQAPIEAEFHSTKGPLPVGYFPHHPDFADIALKAYSEMGYKTNVDLNGKSQKGFAIAQSTNRNGVRMTTARAYLYDNLDRENLYILTDTTVTKVLIDPDTKRATGVLYMRDEERRILRARKEVIISAGAIASPQLLLLSGIGPAADLEAIGINSVVDLPGVGRNLNNHLSTELFFRIGQETNTAVLDNSAKANYFYNHTGPMSSTGMSQLTGFIWTNSSDPRPDLQIFHAGFMANCSTSGFSGERLSPGDKIFTISPTVLNTKSTGYVKLASIFPTDKPLIYGGIMDEPRDTQTLLKGIRIVQNITKTQTMKNLKVELDLAAPKECVDKGVDSDEFWICYIQYNTNPENHQVGTCRMGAADDRLAVTDNRLRVIGVERLRVIDASNLPYTPSGNLQAPVIMVAERGAEFIKQTWNNTLRYKH